MISERTFAKSFASFWQDLLPLLTPRFVGIFNEAYREAILDWEGAPLSSIPISHDSRPDVVAEFAFKGAQFVYEAGLTTEKLLTDPLIKFRAAELAFEVIQRYEGNKPEITHPLRPTEVAEGLALAHRYVLLYSAFGARARVEFCPRFQGTGFLNAAQGDMGIETTLIEVKTTTRRVAGKDLRQLITYLALDAESDRQRWSHIAVFNPRRGTLHRAEVEPLLLRMSGGRPRVDVLSDLVLFAQENDVVIDRQF